MRWDEDSFKKGKTSFIAQDFDSLKVVAILDGRTQATIRNHFLRYSRAVRNSVKVITMEMNRLRIQIMNQFDRKSHEYRALNHYWKPRSPIFRLGLN